MSKSLLLVGAVPDGETCLGCWLYSLTAADGYWKCRPFNAYTKDKPCPECLAARRAAEDAGRAVRAWEWMTSETDLHVYYSGDRNGHVGWYCTHDSEPTNARGPFDTPLAAVEAAMKEADMASDRDLTLDEIREARALCDGATPGPWYEDLRVGMLRVATTPKDNACLSECRTDPATIYYRVFKKSSDGNEWYAPPHADADARFIAASRTLLPRALDMAERVARAEADKRFLFRLLWILARREADHALTIYARDLIDSPDDPVLERTDRVGGDTTFRAVEAAMKEADRD